MIGPAGFMAGPKREPDEPKIHVNCMYIKDSQNAPFGQRKMIKGVLHECQPKVLRNDWGKAIGIECVRGKPLTEWVLIEQGKIK